MIPTSSQFIRRLAAGIVLLSSVILTTPVLAYVDLAPTLAKIIRDSKQIEVVEVDKFSPVNGAAVLTKVRDLKGVTPDAPLHHQLAPSDSLAVPRHILAWAQRGNRAVLFINPAVTLACIGTSWYEAHPAADGWSRIGIERPELPLGYCGPVGRLADAVTLMLDAKDAIITTMPHGADDQGATFDVALNRTSLPGLLSVQRIRANMKMGDWVLNVSTKKDYVIGPGSAAESDIPQLLEKLKSAEPMTRAEAADDLATLGAKAAPAFPALQTLLADAAPAPRLAAAAALARAGDNPDRPLAILRADLLSEDASTRRLASAAVGRAGPAAKPLAANLSALLQSDDEVLAALALQSLTTLGPAAASAYPQVAALLDKPRLAADAADALGRMGDVARPSMKKLAAMLESKEPSVRWAAARAMSQIGGPQVQPVVDFLIKAADSATERDRYNIAVYIGLLGPAAKSALPAMERMPIRNQPLMALALWSVDPRDHVPWVKNNWVFWLDLDFERLLFEAFIKEMGDRARPAAAVLAQRVVDGTAGTPPNWSYRLFAFFPDTVLDTLRQGLHNDDMAVRLRSVVALSAMGTTAAAPAMPEIRALRAKSSDPGEQRLIDWALKQMK